MARAVTLVIYVLLFGGWSTVFFFINLSSLLRWREESDIADWKVTLVLLPPLLAVGLLAYPTLAGFPEELPAAREELLEVSAPVETVQQYTTKQLRGKAGVYTVHRYYISLEGYQGSLYIPKEYDFDQDAFLRWAGPDAVTFRYAQTAGRNTVYEIERADGSVFLDYETSAGELRSAAVDGLIITIVFIVFFAALFLMLPKFLYQDKKGRAARWTAVILGCAGVYLILAGLSIMMEPTVMETPADTSPQITVEITEGVEATLPRGWYAYALDDGGTQWYKTQEKVSTAFRLTKWEWDLPEEEWCQELLADHRDYLLETFVKTPREAMGPFLEELRRSGELTPGTEFWISEGWGTSENNYKNHFLAVFLPRQHCEIMIQSSSSGLTWTKLQAYVEKWIYPLLSGIEITERP